jgi:hypothetical protein
VTVLLLDFGGSAVAQELGPPDAWRSSRPVKETDHQRDLIRQLEQLSGQKVTLRYAA